MQERPAQSLLYIFTDEQRPDTLAVYGNHKIEMPHLNRLAERSDVFLNTYVCQPVCTPSRATLMTGLYPHQHRCVTNNDWLARQIPCIPEQTRCRQYRTAYMGKWHLGDELYAQHGFSEWISIEDAYNAYFRPYRDQEIVSDYTRWLMGKGKKPDNGKFFGRREAVAMPEELCKPAFLADNAIRFLGEQPEDEPFQLFVNFLEPHTPFSGPRNDQYDPSEVTLSPDWDVQPVEGDPLRARLHGRYYEKFGCEKTRAGIESEIRALTARYWGLCSQVDTQVGRILAALEASGHAENTLIVFTSDHGEMMGGHYNFNKTVPYESSAKVPLLIHRPGQNQQRIHPEPVSQIDLVPTVLDLMGESVPAGLPGKSLAPCLRGEREELQPSPVVIEWNNEGMDGPAYTEMAKELGIKLEEIDGVNPDTPTPEWCQDLVPTVGELISVCRDSWRVIVTPDHEKLSVSPRGDTSFYLLDEDPWERDNRIADPACRERVRNAWEQLLAWQAAQHDPILLPEIPEHLNSLSS